MSNKAELKQHFKPCKWFEDKIHSGMRIGNTYYSILKHQGKVHIYDATDRIYKLILIVSNIDEANEWLKQKYNAQTERQTMNNTNKIYRIQDRETGTAIEDCTSKAEALAIVEQYEADDRAEGNYTPDFYEVKELTEAEQ